MKVPFILILFAIVGVVTASPQLWIYTSYNLQVDSNVPVVQGLIDRGYASGYTGIVLDDFKLSIMQSGILIPSYYTNLQTIISYAASKNMSVLPGIYPFGYSEGILRSNYSYAEPQPLRGTPFIVSASNLVLSSSYAGIVDGGFETFSGNTFTSWAWQDSRVVADTSTKHSGACSASIPAGSGNARIVQTLSTLPYRQYHVSFYIKTNAFSGSPNVLILDTVTGNGINTNSLQISSTQDWTQYDYIVNTASNHSLSLYVGVWGSSTGTLWLDDISITETAFVNLVRREGAGVKVYNSQGTVYKEGIDYNPIIDPNATYDDWHTPITVTIPAGSSLKANDNVFVDFFAVVPISEAQVGACLSHPGIYDYMQQNLDAVSAQFPRNTGYFLGYDEMRHMHTCDLCSSKFPTAGELLAWHVIESATLIRNNYNTSNSDIYLWSDMFDPNHNAVDNYYLVDTTISGSWNGVPCEAIMMNWNLGNLNKSLSFFAALGVRQIVAGYYDSGDGTSSGTQEMSAVSGISGVVGAMYTTWNTDYSQLENYAAAVIANWKASSEGLNPGGCAVYGCDGTYSGKKYDLCGVCGGNGECVSSTAGQVSGGSNTGSQEETSSGNVGRVQLILFLFAIILLL